MQKTFVYIVSTKRFEGDTPVETTLTVDTSNLDEQQCRAYAASKGVVPWQSLVRSKKEIPKTATYVIAPVGTRGQQPIDYSAALIKALGSNRAEAAIEKFGSAEKACKALEALFDNALDAEDAQEAK